MCLSLPFQGNDDKENTSPFETNGLKKDEANANGTNGIDDDKGFKYAQKILLIIIELFSLYFQHFSRTPGSRQPSPAEEHLARTTFGLDQGINVNVGGFQPMMQHMLNNAHDQQQMGSSSFHPQHPLGPHVLNGGMPVQVRMIKNSYMHGKGGG